MIFEKSLSGTKLFNNYYIYCIIIVIILYYKKHGR